MINMSFHTSTGKLLEWTGLLFFLLPFIILIVGFLGAIVIDMFGGYVSAEVETNIGSFVGSILIYCFLAGFILVILGRQIQGKTLFQVKKLKKKKR